MEQITTWNVSNIPHYKHDVVTEVIPLFLDNGAGHNLKYLHNIQHYKQNVATEAVQLLLDNGADHKFKNHNII